MSWRKGRGQERWPKLKAPSLRTVYKWVRRFREEGFSGSYVTLRAHITVNKNAVPGDPQSPFVTSGLRIGTPAVTTRGFGESECADLAGWICDILDAMQQGDTAQAEADAKAKVEAVCARLPVYR